MLIVGPYVLNAPCALKGPTLSSLVLGIVSALMGLCVGLDRLWTVPLVWSGIGLGASLLIIVLTRPWYDDVIEATVLHRSLPRR